MGLFGPKKTCAICGGKVGLLGYKIAGEEHICSDCREKCVPGSLPFSSMTAEDVQANIQLAAENKKKGTDLFHPTREFFVGSDHDKPLLFVDEDNGWFMNVSKGDGWVYDLDSITYYSMDIHTSELKKEDKGKGFLDWLFSSDFYSAFPELPRCPMDEKIINAYLVLKLADNDLCEDEVKVNLMPGFFTGEKDVRAAYECAHSFYQFMQNRHANQVTAKKTAGTETDITEQLKRLHSLVQDGILTQEEFDAKKKQLLGI